MANENKVTFDEVKFDGFDYKRGVNRFFKSDLKYYVITFSLIGVGALIFTKLYK
jgi:hypothetical protein